MSMSQARPALYNPRQQGSLRVAKSTSGEASTPRPEEISAPDVGKTRHAVVSNPPLMLPEPPAVVNEEDLNARAPPRARSRTYCVLSPLFEEAVTFTVVNSMGAKVRVIGLG